MFQENVTTGKLLRPKEVAEFIGVRERTIYRLAHNGKIPAFKLGGQWLFNEEIIRQWLGQQMIRNWVNPKE
jgi:excisionase family DNA binding protein